MKISSARQVEFSFGNAAATAGATAVENSGATAAESVTQTVPREEDAGSVASSPIQVPEFRDPGYAQTSRLAGRLNAASVSDFELGELLRERQILLDKKFGGTITRREENRLTYVRWSLDRIEDARHGLVLDQLEHAVGNYERLLTSLRSLGEQIIQRTRGSSERSGRSRRKGS
jgi:hypothetical protein